MKPAVNSILHRMNTRTSRASGNRNLFFRCGCVKEQIRIAAGQPLSVKLKEDIVLRGHAVNVVSIQKISL